MLNKGRTGNEAYDGFSIDLLKVTNCAGVDFTITDLGFLQTALAKIGVY
jgi:hypothetical protein